MGVCFHGMCDGGDIGGIFSRSFGTFEGELREESKDGVEAELALKMY